MARYCRASVVLWALGAAAAAGLSVLGMMSADEGKVSAWALVSLVWCVAMLAGLAHEFRESANCVDRYRSRHKPLAGPRAGAELPS